MKPAKAPVRWQPANAARVSLSATARTSLYVGYRGSSRRIISTRWRAAKSKRAPYRSTTAMMSRRKRATWTASSTVYAALLGITRPPKIAKKLDRESIQVSQLLQITDEPKNVTMYTWLILSIYCQRLDIIEWIEWFNWITMEMRRFC